MQRWVDARGRVHLGGFLYRVPIVLAGEPVACVVTGNLVQIYHRQVLVAEHVQRRKPDRAGQPAAAPRQGQRRGRQPTVGPVVTRIADGSGAVSFAGTSYAAGRAWRGKQLQVAVVAGSVQLTSEGKVVRIHPIRHDRAKEHAAFGCPNGRPRKRAS